MSAGGQPILKELSPSALAMVSTVPPNGDVNPYGVAFVPEGFPAGGPLEPGDILVSNFNNSDNLQGTGTTIVRITPKGQLSVFFHGKAGLGLTTALGILRGGFVIVGNLPTTNGMSDTVQQGSLLILNRFGSVVADLASSLLLDGPWDLAINDEGFQAEVFVSDVLNGTVTRLNVLMLGDEAAVAGSARIASGYTHRFDPNALVIGPTGLAYDAASDTLYVASTGDNEIFAVEGARGRVTDGGKGQVIYHDQTHLHGPLGLVLAPNGDLITANGDAVNAGGTQNALVEFTKNGVFLAQYQLDSGAPGGAFGIGIGTVNGKLTFAAADDVTNVLDVWTIR
jgi:hypothetical protein